MRAKHKRAAWGLAAFACALTLFWWAAWCFPLFSRTSAGKARLTMNGWTCFGPDEEGQAALYAAPAPAPDGMRDDVLERLRALDFGGHYHEARFQQIADDILATIAKVTK